MWDRELDFLGSSGHAQKGFKPVVGEVFSDSANAFVIVFAVNDGSIDWDGFEGFSGGSVFIFLFSPNKRVFLFEIFPI